MFRRVAAYAPDGVTALAVGVVGEVFADRRDLGLPGWEFGICADRKGPVRTDFGLELTVPHGLGWLVAADLVLALPGTGFAGTPNPAALRAFQKAFAHGAIVASHCVGAYLLAAAGLLDGRQATTHWRFASRLADRYPAVSVRPEALYIDEGRVVTGAGAAAGVDLCLHLVRREYGAAVANTIARELVVPPHRDGGQAQYVATPVPADGDDERLAGVIAFARANLDQRLPVDSLAARALLSRRSFIRRFTAATGTTPHAWLTAQRLNRAEELLEATELPVEEVARLVGYGSAAVLRERFVRRRGVPPSLYRRVFSESPALLPAYDRAGQ